MTRPDAPSEGLQAIAAGWRERLEDELPAAVRLRHELHRAPDVSGSEEPTARRVVAAMTAGASVAAGLTTVAGAGRLLHLGPAGPAIGIRAELDALPIVEQTGSPFAAEGAAMHACGHDVHLAAVTALTRAARGVDLPLGLVALLQPREEVGPTGASDVVAAGVLLEHDVRALVAAHVQPQVAAGHVAADAGPVNAAVDEVEIVVTGRGGHGAYPHLAVDPVPALCRIVLALQEAARGAVDPLQPVVVSITQLAGAGAPNVIPGTARAAGTVRTMRTEDGGRLHRRITDMVEGMAAAHGCRGEYVVRRGEPALVNDAGLATATQGWLTWLGTPLSSFASCGSDDFATYGGQLPILMTFVGTGGGADGPMLHDPRYLPPDDAVREVAVALLAGWLGGAQTVLAARA